MAAATRAAAGAWRQGFRYAKASIVLTEPIPVELVRKSLLAEIDRQMRKKLNAALDAVNQHWGRHTLYPAAAGGLGRRGWSTKFEILLRFQIFGFVGRVFTAAP